MVLKEAESKRLMKFLVNLTKGAVKPLVATTVFRKFAKLKGSELGATAYANRFENNLVPIMDQMDNYSIGSRIRVMFALSATVSNDFLELIETTGTVQVDEFGRISKYTSNEGKLSLEGIYFLGAFFFGVSRKIKSTGSNNSTMKAKDFLVTFKYFLLGLDFSELLELSTVFKRKLTSQILQRRFSCTATSAMLSKTYSPQFLNNSKISHCFFFAKLPNLLYFSVIFSLIIVIAPFFVLQESYEKL
eukprot:NP_496583.1 Uncharacterized protein CELE_Y57A10A.3 [Caenorhabditis elegans]